MGGKLRAYRSKRDFSKTGEPAGGPPAASGNRYVVHQHLATASHYDLRLELGGVLKSWAVPKGPSLNPADKRLAVETEDHPLEYIDFEGLIPEGEYGGGPMIVWDAGVWAPMGDAETDLRRGSFKFRLSGEKLAGGWMLTRLKPKPGEEAERNWLLFKERDPAADTKTDILALRPESVKSGRRIEELLERPAPPRAPRLDARSLPGAVRGEMPANLQPQLASQAAAPPKGEGWLHEIKFDGYRTMAHLSGGEVRLITRSGLDWTRRYRDLEAAFRSLPCKEAVIDGEVVVVDEKGVSRISALQAALSEGHGHKLVFYAFDLLHLDGWRLTGVALSLRKALLARLLAGHSGGRSAIQVSDFIEGDGRALFEKASELGLEGIVSKRAEAPYQPGRSHAWVKTKALKVGEFVICGYTVSEAAGGLAALAVAEWDDGELVYRGKVGTGFDADSLRRLTGRLEPLRAGAERLDGMPKGAIAVRPQLTAHVHYANRTADGTLWHAVYKGLREAELTTATAPRKRFISDADLATIWVTNPTRRLFGKSGPTKLDIAVYYAAVGDFMLPRIVARPVSLFRCPSGRLQDCFFQRHAFKGMPASIASFDTVNSEGETKTYISVEDAKGYLALAQFGVVEFHVWGTVRRRLDKPDQIVFDLDPGEGMEWREVVEAALHTRGELQTLGLEPFVKTSGGRGIHVVVPVKPKLVWKQAHQASGEIAAAIAAGAPETFTTVMGKENRKRRIFIDFHRNARGATFAAPYSLRARPGMAASTPLSWADLESIDSPQDLNYASLPGLLAASGDPWADIDQFARDLPVPSKSGK